MQTHQVGFHKGGEPVQKKKKFSENTNLKSDLHRAFN